MKTIRIPVDSDEFAAVESAAKVASLPMEDWLRRQLRNHLQRQFFDKKVPSLAASHAAKAQ